jgi:hypothetical protein
MKRDYIILAIALVAVLLVGAVTFPQNADAQSPYMNVRFLRVLVNLIVDGDTTLSDDLTVGDDVTISGDASVTGDTTLTGALTSGSRVALSTGTQITVTDNCTLTLTAPRQVIVSAADIGLTNVVPSGVGLFMIQNEGSYTATITQTGSIFKAGGNIVLPPEGVVVFDYDGTTGWVWVDKDN